VPWSSSNTAAQRAESTASGSGSEQDPVQAAPVSPGDDPRPVSQLLALPPLTDAIKQVSKNPENPPAHGSYAVPVYNLDPSLTSDMSASVERTLPYHRLAFADGRSRWFTPLLEGLVALVVYVVLITLFTVVMMSIPLIIRADKTTDFGTYIRDDVLNDPLAMFFVFGSVALMFPAIRVARLIFGPRPWGLVHSVQRRVRWSLLLTALVVGAFCYGLLSLLTLMLDGFSSIGFHHKQPHEVAFWLNMVLLLVLVPLQCYAEELVFRGYLMQTIGRWLKNPAWAILLPAPFFMLAHGYDLWGQASIVVMAVLAGFLCWYTGGLEAAIGMHVMNNITTMAMGMFANTDPLQMQSSGTPTDFAMVLATEVLYALPRSPCRIRSRATRPCSSRPPRPLRGTHPSRRSSRNNRGSNLPQKAHGAVCRCGLRTHTGAPHASSGVSGQSQSLFTRGKAAFLAFTSREEAF